MKLIAEARSSGNKVGIAAHSPYRSGIILNYAREQITSFVSFCGGLPAPEHSNGPLAYKFS